MGINKFKKHNILSNCLKSGLNGIEKQDKKNYIKLKSGKIKRNILGSINLDHCYEKISPNENRWDYIIFLNIADYVPCQCIEIHCARSDAVSLIEKKLKWLKDLIISLNGNIKKDYCFIWVATDRIHIPKGTHYYRKLQTLGIKLMKEFKI